MSDARQDSTRQDPARRDHWESVYRTKATDSVSWFQTEPALSLDLIGRTGAGPDDAIVDLGGGASVLVDRLLDRGHHRVAVLDISAAALAASQARLGARAGAVNWIVADATRWLPEPGAWRVWHDRAVFHFLTGAADRDRYLAALRRGLAQGGHLVLGTFAPDGPERCSGLPVQRYGTADMAAVLGTDFKLLDTAAENHRTPAGGSQAFAWGLFQRA